MTKPRTTTVEDPYNIEITASGFERIEVTIQSGKHKIIIKGDSWLLACAAKEMHKARHTLRGHVKAHYDRLGAMMEDTSGEQS